MIEYQPGNRIELLCCGAEYFPALESAIAGARHEVRLETYIFADDETGQRIAAALIAAAQRGVAVYVAYDGFGSSGHIGKLAETMEAGGVNVGIFRPENWWQKFRRSRLRRLHRKLVLIDGRTAFVGGINIIDDLNMPPPRHPRFDYAVSVHGVIVEPIAETMQDIWPQLRRADGSRPGSKTACAVNCEPSGDLRAIFTIRDNVSHRRDIEREYLAAILAARDEIIIANAYFFPGRRFRRGLLRAARRGVKIKLFLQGRQEYILQYYATRALYGTLLDAGVEIYEYRPSFLHAKVAVIDGDWATVGSSNIDPFSLSLAREANVFIRDREFAGTLRSSLVRAMDEESHAIHRDRWSARPLPDRIMTWALYGVARGLMSVLGYGRH